MKKILSFIICITISVSLLTLSSFAAPEFTMKDAEKLVADLEEIADILLEGRIDEFTTLEKVPDEIAFKVVKPESSSIKYTIDNYPNKGHIYYTSGQYKSPEYWIERLNTFLTSEYTAEHFSEILDGGITYCDGEIFVIDGFAVQSSAGYDTFDDLKNKKITQNGDTAYLEFLDELPYDRGYVERKIEFKYTENGWRISGGNGADAVFGISKNPNTADAGAVLTICLFTSILGMCIALSKKKRI